MSLTKSDRLDVIAARLFRDVVIPLAEASQKNGKRYFEMGPDPNAASYFVKPKRSVMEKADFEFSGDASIESLMKAMSNYWIEGEESELCQLIPPLTQIAVSLRGEERQEEEVSEFVYAMF